MSAVINDDVIGCLRDVDYPADRDDLIRIARQAGTPPQMLEVLGSLPRISFNGVYDLQRAISRTGKP